MFNLDKFIADSDDVSRFEPASVIVVDLNENGLAELVRDVHSTDGLYVQEEFRCY